MKEFIQRSRGHYGCIQHSKPPCGRSCCGRRGCRSRRCRAGTLCCIFQPNAAAVGMCRRVVRHVERASPPHRRGCCLAGGHVVAVEENPQVRQVTLRLSDGHHKAWRHGRHCGSGSQRRRCAAAVLTKPAHDTCHAVCPLYSAVWYARQHVPQHCVRGLQAVQQRALHHGICLQLGAHRSNGAHKVALAP